MKITVSVSTSAEDGEKGVSYSSINFSTPGLSKNALVKDLIKLIITWVEKQPTVVQDNLEQAKKQ